MMATSRQLGRLSKLLAELRSESDAEAMEPEALEASGRLQVLAMYRAVEEESLSVAELEEAGSREPRTAGAARLGLYWACDTRAWPRSPVKR